MEQESKKDVLLIQKIQCQEREVKDIRIYNFNNSKVKKTT